MDEKIKQKASVVTGVILIVLAIVLLPISAGMLFSFPHWVGYIGIIMLCCCGAFVYSGVQQISIAKKVIRGLDSIHQQLKQPSNDQANALQSFELAKWTFDDTTWNAFLADERKERKMNIVIECFWVIVLGTVVIILSRGALFLTALIISSLVAAVYGVLKYYLTMRSIRGISAHHEIILTHQAVIINGNFNFFEDQHKRKGKIQLLKKKQPPVIEITYHWQTRRGETFDEIRFPAPNEAEAERIIALLQA